MSCAIHVYGGDFFHPPRPRSQWDHETLTEEPWNVDRSRPCSAKPSRGSTAPRLPDPVGPAPGPAWHSAAPVSLQVHRRLFGAKVDFDCEFDGIVLSQQDLDRVNPRADADMARYARELLDLQPRTRRDSVADEVRRALRSLLPRGGHAIDQVGQHLGMSSRSLQRQLEQLGQSFSSLLNEVRNDLAVRYLGNPAYPVSQVAGLLGFSEVSAFSRWFSTQFGMPPTQWRRKALDRTLG